MVNRRCQVTICLVRDCRNVVVNRRRRFYDQIEGAWWERIRFNGEVQALSFFTISADEVYTSIRLEGEAYGKDGALRAEWRSAGARLEDGRILYVRECSHYIPGTTPKWLPGLGEFNFVPASSGRIDKGSGKFWEGDETQPEKTIIKGVELRRVRKDKHKFRSSGSEPMQSPRQIPVVTTRAATMAWLLDPSLSLA